MRPPFHTKRSGVATIGIVIAALIVSHGLDMPYLALGMIWAFCILANQCGIYRAKDE